MNLKGELIGINAQGQASQDGGTADGMAFSITSNYAKRISSEIIAKGKATHGYLGASVKNTPRTPVRAHPSSSPVVLKLSR